MRRRLSGVLLGLMVVGMLLIPVAAASAVGYTISGRVVDSAGNGVQGDWVQVWDQYDFDQVGAGVLSGPNGEFTTGALPNGKYILELCDTQYYTDESQYWGYDMEAPKLTTVAGFNVTGVEIFDEFAIPADVGSGTITVTDKLTGLPIMDAVISDANYSEYSTDSNGIAADIPALPVPLTVSKDGYQDVVLSSGITDGETIPVEMTLADGNGFLLGTFKDELTHAAITRDTATQERLYATIYTYEAAEDVYYEWAYPEAGADGRFGTAVPVGDVYVDCADYKGDYANEWYEDAKYMSDAKVVSIADKTITEIAPELGAGATISGTISSTGGWTVENAEGPYWQYCDAYSFDESTGEWRYVAGTDTDGNSYAIRGLPAGDYKLQSSTVFGDVNGNPIVVNGEPLIAEAWYKSGTAVTFSDPADMMNTISQAETITVGTGDTVSDANIVIPRLASSVTRVAGATRFDVAATLARQGWNTGVSSPWEGVDHIIVANGDNGKEADPLAAAGLAGVYDCPVLLLQATKIPAATTAVITEIAKANPGVEITIIGGTGSVPDARWYDMKKIPGVNSTKDRITGADRYAVSANIAARMLEWSDPEGVLIVAGDNAAAFYDALAASPMAYARQIPMLCVRKASVPDSVAELLDVDLADAPRYVVNSSYYVSDSVKNYVGAEPARMTTSSDRYTAATQIATSGRNHGWVSVGSTAIAAKLPDALTGGVFSGRNGGVMLFTDSTTTLKAVTKTYITNSKGLYHGWVFGGTGSVPAAQETTFRGLVN